MTEGVAARRSPSLAWGAWTGARIELEVPSEWQVIELPMHDAPALTMEEIDHAMDHPFSAPPLDALAASRGRAAIAIDDITRPTRTAPLLARIVERLRTAGMSLDAVTVVIATGAHRAATADDVRRKLGDLTGCVRVVSHDPDRDVIETDVLLAGQRVRVNREFLAADLRIGICGVMPHPFAGFSGGGKIVLPGLADVDSVVRSHKYALMGFGGGLQLEGNRFRRDMERAVQEIGLHWTANVAMNSRCETAALCCGDFVDAHRAAAAQARRIGATAPPRSPLDALVLNAYPKDSELVQVEAALVAVRAGMSEWLKPSAPVLLLAACPEGVGSHRLFGPGGRLSPPAAPKSYLGGRGLHVVSPAITTPAARTLFWSGYPYHHSWRACLDSVTDVLSARPIVGFAPSGPLHVPDRSSLSDVCGQSWGQQ